LEKILLFLPPPPPITAIITPALGFTGSLFTKRIIGSPGRAAIPPRKKKEEGKKRKKKGRLINEEGVR